MRNYLEYWLQDWLVIDWEDPMNPLVVGGYQYFSDTEEAALAYAATLPAPVPGLDHGFTTNWEGNPSNYPNPTPIYWEINKSIFGVLINNTNIWITGHGQYSIGETPRHAPGWPSNDGTPNPNTPAAAGVTRGGAQKQDPVALFMANVIAILIAKGYKNQGVDLESTYKNYLIGKVSADYAILKAEAVLDAIKTKQ